MACRTMASGMRQTYRRAVQSYFRQAPGTGSLPGHQANRIASTGEEAASRFSGKRNLGGQPGGQFEKQGKWSGSKQSQTRSMPRSPARNPAALLEAMAVLRRLRFMHYMVLASDGDGT